MTSITKRQVNKLAGLDPDRWHQITMQMAWHFRTNGARLVPTAILAVLNGEVPDRSTWNTLRQQVSARRKAVRAEERRFIEARRREARRLYMRKYMKGYRERATNG